jgi:hypothetical protein
MAKKFLTLPLDFTHSVTIPISSNITVDVAIESGEMALSLELHEDGGGVSFLLNLYPDQFDGSLTFKRVKNECIVVAKGVFKHEFDKFTKENLVFPCTLIINSILDQNGDSYYFGKNEDGIRTSLTFASEKDIVR